MSFWKKENTVNTKDDIKSNSINEVTKNDEETSNLICYTNNENINKEISNYKHSSNDDNNSDSQEIVRSALGKGTVIQGKLSFDTPVSIDGKLSGELFSSEAVIIGKSGMVDAQIDVRSLVVYGKISGNIKVADKTVIMSGAEITGSLSTSSLIVEEGATLNCKFQMRNKNRK